MPVKKQAFHSTKRKTSWSQRAPIPLPSKLEQIIHPPLPPDEHAADAARVKGEFENELNKRELAIKELPNPIQNNEQYAACGRFVLDNQLWINASKTEYRAKEIKEKAKEHYELTGERGVFVEGFTSIREQVVKKLMLPYREAQIRAQIKAEAEIRAGLEAQKDQLLAEAQEQEDAGYVGKAQELRAQAQSVVDVVLPSGSPDVPGVKESLLWTGQCDDVMKLIGEVASGKFSLMHEMIKTKNGKPETREVPILVVNQELLDYLATRTETNFNVPGCDSFQELSLSFFPKEK